MTALKRQAKALSSWLTKHKAATDELRARVATTASRLAAHYEAVLQRWRAIAASGSTIAALRELYAQTPLPSELDFAQLHVDERAALARLGRPPLDEALLLRVAGALLTSPPLGAQGKALDRRRQTQMGRLCSLALSESIA